MNYRTLKSGKLSDRRLRSSAGRILTRTFLELPASMPPEAVDLAMLSSSDESQSEEEDTNPETDEDEDMEPKLNVCSSFKSHADVVEHLSRMRIVDGPSIRLLPGRRSSESRQRCMNSVLLCWRRPVDPRPCVRLADGTIRSSLKTHPRALRPSHFHKALSS